MQTFKRDAQVDANREKTVSVSPDFELEILQVKWDSMPRELNAVPTVSFQRLVVIKEKAHGRLCEDVLVVAPRQV